MEIRFTSVPEKNKQKQKNVYNIIKVIPDSFYCLHYASILLVTVPAHLTPFPPHRQTMSYLPCPVCRLYICILNRIAGRFPFYFILRGRGLLLFYKYFILKRARQFIYSPYTFHKLIKRKAETYQV